MSNSASERPPAPSTGQPYASLKNKSSEPRQTGPRVKIPDEVDIAEAPAPPSIDTSPKDSIPPESLRKPYASLTPQKRPSSTPVKDETAGIGSPAPPPMDWADTTEVTSGGSVTRAKYGTCKKHRIAKNAKGDCMMCQREEADNSGGLVWKLILGLVAFACVGGLAIAALI